MTDPLENLIADFSLLDDWEERYRHLMDLGRKLAPLTEAEHCPANKVEGCMSQVWMVADRQQDGTIILRGDSDAHLVKGLIAVLLLAYSGKTPEQMQAVAIESAFERLDLGQHISPNRRNGFLAMIRRIKALAGMQN